MTDALFNGSSVRGLSLLSFLDWAHRSHTAMQGTGSTRADAPGEPVHQFGLLALPPVQRSAVWRPKQVIDLWDSLFRGLPIGSFYLTPRAAGLVRDLGGGRIVDDGRPGHDLFDGQQRTRALLLGVCGPDLDGRCLWIDLAPDAKHRIHLTARSQPFGYDPNTGEKLSQSERVRARRDLERKLRSECRLLVKHRPGEGARAAYDHEIFDLLRGGLDPLQRLPRPYRTSPSTFRLDELLAAWRSWLPDGPSGLPALERYVTERGFEPMNLALSELDAAFAWLRRVEVALLQVDPNAFIGEEKRVRESHLMLFDRVGAGGTPLSDDERLYSIFKHHDPRVHNAVLEIHAAVGRVMAPTKIVVTALRLANALSNDRATGVPNVATFARIMGDRVSETASFRESLAELIPTDVINDPDTARAALLTRAFAVVRDLLEYAPASCPTGRPNPNGLPRVGLVELPSDLWQVLLFWAVQGLRGGRQPADLAPAQDELVRFALFWQLCVTSGDRPSTRAFRVLQENKDPTHFPGAHLYRLLTGALEQEGCALPLVDADTVRRHLVADPPSPVWRSWKERFAPEGAPNGYMDLASTWWRAGNRMLPWLQRPYVAGAFPHYDPLSDRDEDLPYDVDHLCPKADWGANWLGLSSRVVCDQAARDAMGDRSRRWLLGDGIGNKRIIDASQNRSDGDQPLAKKLPALALPSADDKQAQLEISVIETGDAALWLASSGSGGSWDEARLAAFQSAVERRAAQLYERYFRDLNFSVWLDPNEPT